MDSQFMKYKRYVTEIIYSHMDVFSIWPIFYDQIKE